MENNNGNHMHKAVIVFEAVREEQLVDCMTLTVMIHVTKYNTIIINNFMLNSYNDINDHLRTHYHKGFFSFLFMRKIV